MKPLIYVDRLAQAQWFERYGFVAFAAGGCIGIVLGKLASAPAAFVTSAAVGVMLVYALIMWRSTAGRVRADQAGDNLYYLGLLYTLTGLAYAIFSFRPESSSNSIVEGFGIALATTIVGLMLRVFFNQIRLDLVEVEDRARMDLAQAASALKAELSQIVVEMNDFGRQTRQSLAEAVNGVQQGMISGANEASAGITRLSSNAERTLTASFARVEACADELAGSTHETSAAIAENAGAFRKVTKAAAASIDQLSAFAEVAERSVELAGALAGQAEQARAVQATVAATGVDLQAQVQSIGELLSQMRTGVERSLEMQDERLRALEQAPMLAAEQVSEMLADVQKRVQADLASVTLMTSETIEGQLTALREAVSTLRNYNSGLADELEKSRGYATTVLGSLVTSVDALTDRITNGEEIRQ